jgi:hypothetical protein
MRAARSRRLSGDGVITETTESVSQSTPIALDQRLARKAAVVTYLSRSRTMLNGRNLRADSILG